MYTIYISYLVSNHSHHIPIWLTIQYLSPPLPPPHKTLIPHYTTHPPNLQNTHTHSTHTHILHTPWMGYTLSIPTKIHIEFYKYCFSPLFYQLLFYLFILITCLQDTICCICKEIITSIAPEDGRVSPKHVELIVHK